MAEGHFFLRSRSLATSMAKSQPRQIGRVEAPDYPPTSSQGKEHGFL